MDNIDRFPISMGKTRLTMSVYFYLNIGTPVRLQMDSLQINALYSFKLYSSLQFLKVNQTFRFFINSNHLKNNNYISKTSNTPNRWHRKRIKRSWTHAAVNSSSSNHKVQHEKMSSEKSHHRQRINAYM